MSGEYAIYGPIQGLVIGDQNRVEIVLPPGDSVPFMAPTRPPHGLVGRADLLAALRQDVLAGRDSALFALNGIPGVGKTALAIALAHDPQVGAVFRGGVLWAGLGPDADLMMLMGQWGLALGIPANQVANASTPESRAQMIHVAIGLRRMLLVIDDAWTIEAALTFRLGGPNSVHLLTTRIPEVAARFALHTTQVRELDPESGFELLTRLAPEAVRTDPSGAQSLVGLVAGHPLALVLLGNYLRVQSVGGSKRRVRETIAQLRNAENRLAVSEPRGILDARPAVNYGSSVSLLASIELSDKALTPVGRLALRDITVFPAKPNSFGADSAADVVGGGATAVESLVDLGLLEWASEDRYALHQAIHDYASQDGPSAQARERLVRHYVTALSAAAAMPADTDAAEWSADTVNILTALDNAHQLGMRAELVSGANEFSEYLQRHGMFAQAKVHLERALAAADELETAAARSRTRINLAGVLQQQGELQKAGVRLQDGLRLAREAGAPGLEYDALLRLGWVLGMSGEVSGARVAFTEALDVHAPQGRPGARAAVLQGMGWLDGVHGQKDSAAKHLRDALKAARTAGEGYQVADILQSLGWMEGMRGRYAEAHTAFSEAADKAREGHFPTILVDALNGLGWLDGLRGAYSTARARFEEAFALAEATGYAERGTLLGSLAWVTKEEGDFQGAYARFQQALAWSKEAGDAEKTALFLGKLAELEVLLDQLNDAEAHARQSVEAAQARHLPDRIVEPMCTLAEISRLRGRPEAALTLLDEASRQASATGNSFLLAVVGHERGLTLLDMGDLDAAESSLTDSQDHAVRADAGDFIGKALHARAKVALARGDVARARTLADEAVDVFSRASPVQARQVSDWRAQLGEHPT